MTAGALRRIALLLEYDGSRYAGSQLQQNAVTVQFVLEDGIKRATDEFSRAAFAGRTDAGVHARGQVASFLTHSRHSPAVMRDAINARLPEDVAVIAASEVETGFDVRRHARSRHYRYLLSNRYVRPALDRSRAWHVKARLDEAAMADAAAGLLGRHDFRAFAAPLEKDGASGVRDLSCFSVQRHGDLVILDVTANAFLPHQVRRMAGALVEVGKGRRTPAEYAALLTNAPASVGPAAPAHGLCLMQVDYERSIFAIADNASVDSSKQVC